MISDTKSVEMTLGSMKIEDDVVTEMKDEAMLDDVVLNRSRDPGILILSQNEIIIDAIDVSCKPVGLDDLRKVVARDDCEIKGNTEAVIIDDYVPEEGRDKDFIVCENEVSSDKIDQMKEPATKNLDIHSEPCDVICDRENDLMMHSLMSREKDVAVKLEVHDPGFNQILLWKTKVKYPP